MKTDSERYTAAAVIYQRGTPFEEIPQELLQYINEKYPLEPLTAELLERAERERRGNV